MAVSKLRQRLSKMSIEYLDELVKIENDLLRVSCSQEKSQAVRDEVAGKPVAKSISKKGFSK